MIAVLLAFTFVGAVVGFFVRKRSSGWCPDCGGPAQLLQARTVAELLDRAARRGAPESTAPAPEDDRLSPQRFDPDD